MLFCQVGGEATRIALKRTYEVLLCSELNSFVVL